MKDRASSSSLWPLGLITPSLPEMKWIITLTVCSISPSLLGSSRLIKPVAETREASTISLDLETKHLVAMTSNRLAMASNRLAMASNRLVMASNLLALAWELADARGPDDMSICTTGLLAMLATGIDNCCLQPTVK